MKRNLLGLIGLATLMATAACHKAAPVAKTPPPDTTPVAPAPAAPQPGQRASTPAPHPPQRAATPAPSQPRTGRGKKQSGGGRQARARGPGVPGVDGNSERAAHHRQLG